MANLFDFVSLNLVCLALGLILTVVTVVKKDEIGKTVCHEILLASWGFFVWSTASHFGDWRITSAVGSLAAVLLYLLTRWLWPRTPQHPPKECHLYIETEMLFSNAGESKTPWIELIPGLDDKAGYEMRELSGAGLGRAYKQPQSGPPRSFLRCRVVNEGAEPIYNVSLEVYITFKEVEGDRLQGPSKPASDGVTKPVTIGCSRIAQGDAHAFAFDIVNRQPLYVEIELPFTISTTDKNSTRLEPQVRYADGFWAGLGPYYRDEFLAANARSPKKAAPRRPKKKVP